MKKSVTPTNRKQRITSLMVLLKIDFLDEYDLYKKLTTCKHIVQTKDYNPELHFL